MPQMQQMYQLKEWNLQLSGKGIEHQLFGIIYMHLVSFNVRVNSDVLTGSSPSRIELIK